CLDCGDLLARRERPDVDIAAELLDELAVEHPLIQKGLQLDANGAQEEVMAVRRRGFVIGWAPLPEDLRPALRRVPGDHGGGQNSATGAEDTYFDAETPGHISETPLHVSVDHPLFPRHPRPGLVPARHHPDVPFIGLVELQPGWARRHRRGTVARHVAL